MRTQTARLSAGQSARSRVASAGEPSRSEVLRSVICNETVRLCLEHSGDGLRALVLTGSLARNEATFEGGEGRWTFWGDAEFLLVCDSTGSLPPAARLAELRTRIEEALVRCGIACRIALSAVRSPYLSNLLPHLFAYELRACGRVVWGDPHILSLIPAFSPRDLSLEDAWRLLCNRMVEHLEVMEELADASAPQSGRVHYRTVKLYLDMATSFLIFAGAYAPTYRERAENLDVLARSGALPAADGPFPLKKFSERVTACTQVKLLGPDKGGLSGIAEGREGGMELWEEAVSYARALWRWELACLTGDRGRLSDCTLLRMWMRVQPIPHRLRGWLYVLRRGGWHRSWREWPRWAWHGWAASPRYWVYAAAGELLFRMPEVVGEEKRKVRWDRNWERLHRLLPVRRGRTPETGLTNWRELAADIVWNYHEFLEGTRS
jgi:hypothetical protein